MRILLDYSSMETGGERSSTMTVKLIEDDGRERTVSSQGTDESAVMDCFCLLFPRMKEPTAVFLDCHRSLEEGCTTVRVILPGRTIYGSASDPSSPKSMFLALLDALEGMNKELA